MARGIGNDSTASPGTEELNIHHLRKAIRSNRCSFPSQVPVFSKHDRPDLQSRNVLLYLLFGWSCARIGIRYRLRRQSIQQILRTWARRAVETGYLQRIPPPRVLGARSRALSNCRPIAATIRAVPVASLEASSVLESLRLEHRRECVQ